MNYVTPVALRKADVIQVGAKKYELVRKSDDHWFAESLDAQPPRTFSAQELDHGFADRSIELVSNSKKYIPKTEILETGAAIELKQPFADLLEKNQKIVDKRLTYVKAVYNRDPSLESLIETIVRVAAERGETAPNLRTVQVWLRWYREGNETPLSLLGARIHGPRKYKRELREVRIRLIREAIDDIDEACEAAVVIDVINDVRKKFKASQVKCPSDNTLRRLFDEIPPSEAWPNKFGRALAAKFGRHSKGPIVASRPLEVVQFDSTQLDTYCLIPELENQGFRLWVTLATDVYTRAILGYYLGIGRPSQLTSLEALKCAILPKGWVKERFPDLEMDWIMHGAIEVLVTDRGTEHGAGFQSSLHMLGTTHQYTQPATPWKNGIAEAANGSLKKNFRTLPGSTHRDPKLRNPKRMEKAARLTQDDMERALLGFIHKHNSDQHEATGERPDYRWMEAVKNRPVRPAPRESDLAFMAALSVDVTATHKGVRWMNIQYNSSIIKQIRDENRTFRPGEKQNKSLKLVAKIYPRDVSSIYLLDPKKNVYVQVDAVRKDLYSGVSIEEHKQILVLAKKLAKLREKLGFKGFWSERDYESAKAQVKNNAPSMVPKRGLGRSAKAAIFASATGHQAGPNGPATSGEMAPDRSWLADPVIVNNVTTSAGDDEALANSTEQKSKRKRAKVSIQNSTIDDSAPLEMGPDDVFQKAKK